MIKIPFLTGTDKEGELHVQASVIDPQLVPRLLADIAANEDLFARSKIVLMADAHVAGLAPVGFTMLVQSEYIAPDLVSSDIGCGVSSLLLHNCQLRAEQLTQILKRIRQEIPINKKIPGLDSVEGMPNTNNTFGTLGGGNHFIEIGENNGDLLLSVHSGSRAFGGSVHKAAIAGNDGSKSVQRRLHSEARKAIAEQLKAEGRQAEIAEALQAVKVIKPKIQVPYVSKDSSYLSHVEQAVQWAKLNREAILEQLRAMVVEVSGVEHFEQEYINSTHNYIERIDDQVIIRKGSIAAPRGLRVVIPLNMRDGIIVGTSCVTETVNYSLPHGAGRVLSRTQAKAQLSLADFKAQMQGITSVTVDEHRLDEAPDAYKKQVDILKDITPYLSEYRIFRAILNYKG